MVRGLSKHKIPYLKFYYMSTDPEPHYTQWYDPECGYVKNGQDENTCAFCLKSYNAVDNDVEWIKCPICENWFHEQYFFWSSCHRLSFWPWCSCNIEGILSAGWKTIKSTVDFHFFDTANQKLYIAFLLNFWTLQRSFCIGKLRFDTLISIRPDFLRYLLNGKGNLFLQISLQPFDR